MQPTRAFLYVTEGSLALAAVSKTTLPRFAPPEHALVPGAATGHRASAVVALGFIAMVASSPGQTYWLSLFVDDMIAGTGLGRTGFSVVRIAAAALGPLPLAVAADATGAYSAGLAGLAIFALACAALSARWSAA